MIIQFDKKISGEKIFEALRKIPEVLNMTDPGWELTFHNEWVATKDGFEIKEIYMIELSKSIKVKIFWIFPDYDQVGFRFPKIRLKKMYSNVYIDNGYASSGKYFGEEKKRDVVAALFKALAEIDK
jgi:hypothetical protein